MKSIYRPKVEDISNLKAMDVTIGKLIDLVGDVEFEIIDDPFLALVNSIIYQQLSFKAANTIWNRVVSLVGDISPERIIEIRHEDLRTCGVSNSKAGYIKNVANAFIDNGYSRVYFDQLSDEDVVAELIKIKGIGKWTADMFLIFCLGRENVLSFADLSIKNGLVWLYKLDREIKKSDYDDFHNLFSPYNTLASLYIWKIQENKFDRYESIEKI
ncbi:MAG: DNA-3-methyladenine glycosylase [Firmicutes bacterium]|jgi:3-methyladenine DNA glycosylase/8-oxoguanine DNA glycosylase|nr:DNA-3-methyladenine glycosylase [Bacillota bacterium]